MKKLFISITLLLVSTGIYAYTCSAYTDAHNKQLESIKTTKTSLCGSVANFNGDSCKDTTPDGLTGGGLWGDFKSKCFQDKKGACLIYDEGKAQYTFMCRSINMVPPSAPNCGNIVCVKSDLLEKIQGLIGKGCSDPMSKGMKLDTDTILVILAAIGTGPEGTAAAYAMYHLDDYIRKYDRDKGSESTCQADCTSFWAQLQAVKDSQTALDSLNNEELCPCDDQCHCENDTNGAWVNNACICDGLRGMPGLDECICTRKTPAGIWFKGKCYPKGKGYAGVQYDNTGDGSSGSTATTSSSSDAPGLASTSASASGPAADSTSNGSGQNAGGATGSTISSATWSSQLKSTLGSIVGGSKLSGSNSKEATLSGLNNGGKKNVAVQGISDEKESIWKLVSDRYDQLEKSGVFAAPDFSSGVKNPKSGKVGTTPHTY